VRPIISHSFKTLPAFALLLFSSACIVTPAVAIVPETTTPSLTPTATQVWFPPTFTPSPLPQPNITATPNLRPDIGEVLVEDDFSDEEAWTTSSGSQATINIDDGEIHLSLNDDHEYLLAMRNAPAVNDFYAEITASPSLCRGEDEYGFVLRAGDHGLYRFALTCDGRAKVDRLLGKSSVTRQAGWLENPVVPSVIPATVRLAVWAHGSQIHFFLNDVYLFSVNDTVLWKGTLGVFVHTSGDDDVSVNFSDLKVWALTQ
jgi:hypothetical protein